MAFPDQKYSTAEEFASAYFRGLSAALDTIDRTQIVRAAAILRAAIDKDQVIFSCGNGGSAAIANHLLCDCSKGIRTDTSMRPRVLSLSSATEMITAIANDIAFDEVFVYQLQSAARPGDVLITISSSGNSENIVRAIAWARTAGMKTIAMSGFSGGRSAQLADVNLHVTAHNYGLVEDVHQSLMHILSQYLRQSEMPAALIASRKF
jgi:D-sedoheptulose 7-phosphate isomerase